jgi:hypothetical protein
VVAPRTPVEEQLTQIWADVLGIERVGVFDTGVVARRGRDTFRECPDAAHSSGAPLVN